MRLMRMVQRWGAEKICLLCLEEPSQMKRECRDAIYRVQALVQCARGGRDKSRPYMLMPDSFGSCTSLRPGAGSMCGPGGHDKSRPSMLMPDSLVHVH